MWDDRHDWIFPSDQNSCRLEKWNQIHFISGIPSSNHLCYYFLVGMKLLLDAWLSIQKQGSFQPHSSKEAQEKIQGEWNQRVTTWLLRSHNWFPPKEKRVTCFGYDSYRNASYWRSFIFFRTTRCEVKAVSTFQGWMFMFVVCCCCCCCCYCCCHCCEQRAE